MLRSIAVSLLSILGGMLGAVAIQIVQHELAPPPSFVTVDVQSLLTQHIRAMAQNDRDEAAQRQDAASYAAALERALDDVSTQDHALVMVGPAVLRGASDATAEIASRVQALVAASTSPPAPAGGVSPAPDGTTK